MVRNLGGVRPTGGVNLMWNRRNSQGGLLEEYAVKNSPHRPNRHRLKR